MTERQSPASRAAQTNGTTPAVPRGSRRGGAAASWVDDRVGLAGAVNTRLFTLRKVFPEHWSFMFGEIALWSLVVLLLTGTFLTFWFDPSMAEVQYQGSYDALRGAHMSAAYASTLDISFDVRGGLLMRQMHHWSAHLFIAAMMIHLLRHALTGSFRKPREVNWVIGCLMLLLGTLQGFFGYSLPDDLLSGTGLRIADGIVKATPVVGTYLSFFLFGGEFPGEAAIPRLYIIHVLLLPALLLALVALHLILVFYHKHTQWPGPGRSERNVVGYPFFPVYAAKTTGFFFDRLRCHCTDGRPALDQPGVEVRSVRPGEGHCRLPARLVSGLRRRGATDHAGVGDARLGRDDLVERGGPRRGPAGRPLGHRPPVALPRVLGDGRPAGASPAPASPGRARPDRIVHGVDQLLRSAVGRRGQRCGRHELRPERQPDHQLHADRGLRGPSGRIRADQTPVHLATASGPAGAARRSRDGGRHPLAGRRLPRARTGRSAEAAAYTLLAGERDQPNSARRTSGREHDGRRGRGSSRLRHQLSQAMFAANLPPPTAEELEHAGHHRPDERSAADPATAGLPAPEDPPA